MQTDALPEQRRIPLWQRRGFALLRVWGLLAAAGAILGAILGLVAEIINVDAWMAHMVIWTLFAAGEDCCLFGSWRSRAMWIVLGGFAGGISTASWKPTGYFVVGMLEMGVCAGTRRRPWVWPIATYFLHATSINWLSPIWTLVEWVFEYFSTLFPSISSFGGYHLILAPYFAVCLIVRALVGCFLSPPLEDASTREVSET